MFIEANEDLINWHELSYNKYITRDVIIKYRFKLSSMEEVENTLFSNSKL